MRDWNRAYSSQSEAYRQTHRVAEHGEIHARRVHLGTQPAQPVDSECVDVEVRWGEEFHGRDGSCVWSPTSGRQPVAGKRSREHGPAAVAAVGEVAVHQNGELVRDRQTESDTARLGVLSIGPVIRLEDELLMVGRGHRRPRRSRGSPPQSRPVPD